MGHEEITTLIVDDEPAIRELVSFLIECDEGGMCVIGQASDGIAAVDAAAELHPEVVILDMLMPGLDGLETAERILAATPGQRIILFSASLSMGQHEAAMSLGVRACVDKLDVADITDVIRQVVAA